MNNHSYIKECPITGHDEQIKYFDLGNIPLVNNLCNSREEALNAERFPLNVNYYPASGESSLDFAVDSDAAQLQRLADIKYYEDNVVYTTARNCIAHPGEFYLIPQSHYSMDTCDVRKANIEL